MSKRVEPEVIPLKNVRLSFPELWKAKAYEEGKKPQYQAAFLLDPKDPDHKKAIKAIKAEAKRLMKAQWGEVPESDEYKRCFGLSKDHPKKRKYDGYEGMFYIDASNTKKPIVMDRRKNDVVEEDDLVVAGVYVNTNITLWLYDHPKGGKGIGCNLRIVQFFKDGERFGSGGANRDEMDEIDDPDTDDDDWDDEDDL